MVSEKCDFCHKNLTDVFHISLINKLKDSKIIPKKYPNLCAKCYDTFSSLKKLEKFLEENEIKCTDCGINLIHFETICDGKGYTTYSTCEGCGQDYAISISSDFFVKLSKIAQLEIPPEISQ